ncbi:MAG: M1 family metallopeptidase [Chloroflexi bacterium]|nr:M1 family metallopeptidase [Chloroflexota bacterium]
MRSRIYFWVVILVLSACNPFSNAAITPASTPAPTKFAVDDLAIYRLALTSTAQNDLALIDRPTRYNLTLKYDDKNATLSGTQQVIYLNHESVPLNEIYFRLFANYPDSGGKIEVTQVQVNGESAAPVLEAKNTALRVPLKTPLAPDASTSIHLEFSVTIPRGKSGHYNDFVATESVVTLPTVYPLIPAHDSQGWHIELPPAYGDLVYADVSFYTVTITVPSNMVVIASGSTIGLHDNNDGTSTWTLAGAPMRDFDINLTSQLNKVSTVIGETTINSYSEPKDTEAGKQALQVASDAFKVFVKRFGPYPYRELDVVETPTSAGGIEYPGIVVVGSSLYNDSRSQQYFEFATAHEVSHQWWYAMVGNDQVNYPWVDEALAQYSTLLYVEDLRGTSAANAVLRGNFQGLYNRARNQGRDAAVNQPVGAFDENDYGAIVYGKGPLFFDAIRKKMGDDKFFKLLSTYFERYRYKITFPEDVLKTAEEINGASLQTEYDQWINSPKK